MQRRFTVQRALAAKPRLLVLEEPTEGIQPSIIKAISRVIRMLAGRRDMAIVLVSSTTNSRRNSRCRVRVAPEGSYRRRLRSPAASRRVPS